MTKISQPTEIFVENIPTNRDFIFPASLRVPVIFHTAKKVAALLFAEHQCRFEETPEGLLGTYPEGDQVLLSKDSIMGIVLSSLVDSASRDLKIELDELVKQHDEQVRDRAQWERHTKVIQERMEKHQRQREAKKKVLAIMESIQEIRNKQERIPPAIQGALNEIDLIHRQGGTIPGQVSQFPTERIQQHENNIAAWENRYTQLEKVLQDEESKLEDARREYQKLLKSN